ncbi:13963_t:CDS:2 [Racocetra persica]|uniref:13963_t:CDS:1 n=1 Tax=Racocetra persica TaxID=160502 RepID=A0ACA9KY53_9GLOM|nr:13963_t:CDS:2 [Racocetra persica]
MYFKVFFLGLILPVIALAIAPYRRTVTLTERQLITPKCPPCPLPTPTEIMTQQEMEGPERTEIVTEVQPTHTVTEIDRQTVTATVTVTTIL